MENNLYWNTVTPLLKSTLDQLMGSEIFYPFRLVGGTSLSLQLGHRISVDIDLFTDREYGSVDFRAIEKYLRGIFTYVSSPASDILGMGQSYLIGSDENNSVKLDLYYTDSFIQSELVIGSYRLATVEEIIAMKVDVVQMLVGKRIFGIFMRYWINIQLNK